MTFFFDFEVISCDSRCLCLFTCLLPVLVSSSYSLPVTAFRVAPLHLPSILSPTLYTTAEERRIDPSTSVCSKWKAENGEGWWMWKWMLDDRSSVPSLYSAKQFALLSQMMAFHLVWLLQVLSHTESSQFLFSSYIVLFFFSFLRRPIYPCSLPFFLSLSFLGYVHTLYFGIPSFSLLSFHTFSRVYVHYGCLL